MKVCGKCKEEKPLSDFNNWSKSKDGKHHTCRFCQREYQKSIYKNNPDRRKTIRDTERERRNKIASFINDYKSSKGCADCGNRNPLVLDFDHISGKNFTISRVAGHGGSIDKIKSEIRKCEVVCSNCHRIRTYNRKNRGFKSH